MTRSSRFAAAAAAASLLTLAAACGGTDQPADTATTEPAAAADLPGLEPGPLTLDTPRANPFDGPTSCAYLPSGEAAKAVEAPAAGGVDTAAAPTVTLATSAGDVALSLDAAHSPCTVNSMVSLAGQGYFDGTVCHRLTTKGIFVLQCGDPTGTGMGGPGYMYANEFPTDQFGPTDPRANGRFVYPRGVVAMANAGPGTNGSQFFLVFEDSPLPPLYTVFGTVDEAGLAVLDTVAAAGAEGGAPDGPPATPVTIESATVS